MGYKPKFYVLDVTVPENVRKLRDHISERYGGLDLLVNNAGIAITVRYLMFFAESSLRRPAHYFSYYSCSFVQNATGDIETFEPFEVRQTIRVNYSSLRDTCNMLFPILRPHARVVNVSSSCGHLTHIPGQHLRDVLASPDLTEDKLNAIIASFIR